MRCAAACLRGARTASMFPRKRRTRTCHAISRFAGRTCGDELSARGCDRDSSLVCCAKSHARQHAGAEHARRRRSRWNTDTRTSTSASLPTAGWSVELAHAITNRPLACTRKRPCVASARVRATHGGTARARMPRSNQRLRASMSMRVAIAAAVLLPPRKGQTRQRAGYNHGPSTR